MTKFSENNGPDISSAKPTIRSKFSKLLTLFLPGNFLLGFNIGTGSVTSMAKAGATNGMSLLWTIVASCRHFVCRRVP